MYQKLLSTLLCLCLLFTWQTSTAQITISNSDLAPYYQIGNVITQNFDTSDVSGSFNIGMPGGGNSWDFSNVMLATLSEQQMIVDPSTTPAASDYSNANVSIFFEIDDEDGMGDFYNYLNISADGIDFLGTWSTVEADGETIISTVTSDPIERILPFPVAFGNTWSYEGKQTINTEFNGMSFPLSSDDVKNTYLVDAYGSLTFPNGTTENALRIKETNISTFELIPGFPFVDTTLSFFFITKSGATLIIDAENSNAPDQGTIQGSLTWSTSSGASNTNDLEAQGFELPAIAPNPLRQNTMIDFTLPSATTVQINLFDQNGRRVKSLFNGRQEAGLNRVELDIEGLASGQYYLSLLAQNGVITRKVIVQR